MTSRDVKDFGTIPRGGKEIGTKIPVMGTGTELERNEFQLQILERERNLVPLWLKGTERNEVPKISERTPSLDWC